MKALNLTVTDQPLGTSTDSNASEWKEKHEFYAKLAKLKAVDRDVAMKKHIEQNFQDFTEVDEIAISTIGRVLYSFRCSPVTYYRMLKLANSSQKDVPSFLDTVIQELYEEHCKQ